MLALRVQLNQLSSPEVLSCCLTEWSDVDYRSQELDISFRSIDIIILKVDKVEHTTVYC